LAPALEQLADWAAQYPEIHDVVLCGFV
jgi:hypothetical protein